MAGPLDLHLLAEELENACVSILNTLPSYDPELKGAPDRHFTHYGIPVWDCCEQLAVHAVLLSEAETTPGGLDAGQRANRYARLNHVRLTASLTRCVTSVGEMPAMGDYHPPTPEALTVDAKQHHADAWALWNLLFNLKASGDFLTLCDAFFFEGILPFAPAGGCAGWTVVVRAVLGGYQEPAGS